MSLPSGTRLGPYEVVAPIGAGGMGEVYKARDTRLDRHVALKILGPRFQDDPAGRERFEREARAIAALEHPHICVLHDVGRHDGVDFLVMQFLEGETLASLLARKRDGLPLEQTLQIAREIAVALAAAHRRGIVHRDLKPGNVMLTKGGVKLLDFGLAREVPLAPEVTVDATREGPLTSPGMLVGTPQYMAPEQIEGRAVDARSDIFALGCVLHEMLTGRRAFSGTSQAAVISAVLERDPQTATELQPRVPGDLADFVRACMAKDPEQRWQSAADIARILEGFATRTNVPTRQKPRSPMLVPVAAAVVAAALASVLTARWLSSRAASPEPLVLSVIPPAGAVLHPRTTNSLEMAVSPDGRALAFIASFQGQRRLFVRSLDSIEARVIAGSEGADFPFWSPDSSMIGFFARGRLKKASLAGGAPQDLCDVGSEGGGATWSRDGVIVFSPFFEGALYRVSASGGTPQALTQLDAAKGETHHFRPRFLPDGRHFLYQVYARVGAAEYVGSLDSPDRQALIQSPEQAAGFMGVIADYAPGHLIYVRDSTLFAQPFDPDRRQLHGEPVRLAEDVARSPGGAAAFTASSASPVIAYRTADPQTTTRLTWFDRTGGIIGSIGPEAAFEDPVLSPDGTRVVVQRWDTPSRRSIWILDSARGSETRFTRNPDDLVPLWSPDGSRVVYASARDTPPNLFIRPLTGDESAEYRLFSSRFFNIPLSWSADGQMLIYQTFEPDSSYDVATFDFKTQASTPLVKTPFDDRNGRLSPDGKWLAYSSDETGRREVYVKPIDGSAPAERISAAGGDFPLWRSGDTELLYLEGRRRLMSVAVRLSPKFSVIASNALFEARFGPSERSPFDISADGRRILVNLEIDESGGAPITVLQNWPTMVSRQQP